MEKGVSEKHRKTLIGKSEQEDRFYRETFGDDDLVAMTGEQKFIRSSAFMRVAEYLFYLFLGSVVVLFFGIVFLGETLWKRKVAVISVIAVSAGVWLFDLGVHHLAIYRIAGVSLGSLLILSPIIAIWVKSGLHRRDDTLNTFDWVFLLLTVLGMPIFDLLGLDSWYWVAFMFMPLLFARAAIMVVIRRRRHRNGQK